MDKLIFIKESILILFLVPKEMDSANKLCSLDFPCVMVTAIMKN